MDASSLHVGAAADSASLNRFQSSRPHTRGVSIEAAVAMETHPPCKTARQQKRPARGGGVSGGREGLVTH